MSVQVVPEVELEWSSWLWAALGLVALAHFRESLIGGRRGRVVVPIPAGLAQTGRVLRLLAMCKGPLIYHFVA